MVMSRTGTTAGIAATARPAAPIVVVGDDPAVCRRANLLWGVVPIRADAAELRHPHALARRLVRELGLASGGQYILMITGFKAARAEAAPTLTVLGV